MTSFIDLAAPGVKGLMPYQPGKPIEELQREYGVNEVIKLASNENPLGPDPRVIDAISKELTELARYPDGNGFELKKAIAEKHAVAMDCITLGNGSNDILELLARGFVTSENEIIFSQHSFAVYPIVTQAVNAKAIVTPAKDWGHDLQVMQAAITENTRLIFIANPNNPTGTWLGKQELHQFLENIPNHVIVVIDEAYFDYADDAGLGAEDYPNAIEWLSEFPHLVVTRTFSKAYGLAGLRIGYSVSDAEIADCLNRVRQPFNVNHLALKAAVVALQDQDHLQRGIQCNASGMHQLLAGFEKLSLQHIPSVGNFVCVEVGENAAKIYDDLLYEGVIVRPIANYQMPNHLRVTIGTEQENQIFLAALTKVL